LDFVYSDFARRALRGLLEPATAVLDPSRRVFAPFLLASLALALAVQVAQGRGVVGGMRSLFAWRVWGHRSSRIDAAFIALRVVLRAHAWGAWGVSSLVVGALTAGWLRRHAGDSPVQLPRGAAAALFTLVAFLADDVTRFALHRWMHRIPWLWAFHRVHHAAEVLTPFTLYRTHPVEAALNQARGALALGLVTGASAWLSGPSLRAWELLGVDAVGFLWTLLGANLRHSHVWLSYGPRVERWLLSPAQHQVHHSDDPRHHDRNFGEVLAVWDRLASSLYVTHPSSERVRFGLPAGDPLAGGGAITLLLVPFLQVARDAARQVTPMKTRLPRLAALGAALTLAVVPSGCTSPAPVDRAAVLQAFGRCTASTAQEFVGVADALATATAAHADGPGEATRDAARAAWLAAMDVWQRAEMMQYGPAALPALPGGRGLRDAIYAWPDVNRCLIDQNLVSRAWEQGAAGLGANARGLAAAEYLLFYTGAENGCAPTEGINAMGSWAALSAAELAARRAAYARAVTAEVAVQARALTAAWEPTGFAAQLATAGRGSTLFATQQAAVSAVADAVFRVDTDLKDLRLGRPLGVRDCTTGTCPAAAESPWADRGVRHVRNNLTGARALLLGCAAGGNLGFDDLLDGAGASALSAQLRTRLDAADAAGRAVPVDGTVAALASHQPALRGLLAAAQELSGFLKMELTTTLQIQGSRVEGDND